jgi:hypothetical protein
MKQLLNEQKSKVLSRRANHVVEEEKRFEDFSGPGSQEER